MNQRALGGALLVVGVALALVGAVGELASDDGGDASAITSTTAVTAGTTTTTTRPDVEADVRAFVVDLAAAIRGGDAAFLLARLHPAVLERYGEDQCRAVTDGLASPGLDLEVLDVGAPEAWDWQLDGETVSTRVDEAVPVRVRRTDGASSEETEIHVAETEGVLRWFTDCGDPR
jgi:hypothetical protein